MVDGAALQFSAAARPKHNNLQYVDYTSVLVQEMEIALDEEFLRRLLSFALELAPYGDTPQSRSSGSERDQGTVFERAPVRWWQQGHPGSSEGSTASTRYFFQELQFNALCLNVSFRRVPSAVDQSLTLISPVTLTLNALGMVAMSVERSPLRLSGLKMSQVLQTRTGLVSRVVRHYRNQGLQVRPSVGFGHCPHAALVLTLCSWLAGDQELYKVVFSLDMLGNPVGLINALGSGVKDFFVEPALGLVKSPKVQSHRTRARTTHMRTHSLTRGCLVCTQDFGQGLAHGSLSLLSNTARGVGMAATGIVSSVSRAAALLSLDDGYMRERQARTAAHRTDNVAQGLLAGGSDVAHGVTAGLTGLFTSPYQGAQREGVGGFFKGLGKVRWLLVKVARSRVHVHVATGIDRSGCQASDGYP